MDDQIRLLALAHLRNGRSPTEVSNAIDITYARALKLRKQLLEAEENDAIRELFNMEDAAIEILLESVKNGLQPIADLAGMGELVDEEVDKLASGVAGLKKLDVVFQDAASAVATKIKSAAMVSNNAETILSLAEALCKLQLSFFGQGGANPGGNAVPGIPGPADFEKLLRR